MDKNTAKTRLDNLHTKLLEDILYTELISEGKGFVDYNMHLIELESGEAWNEDVAKQRVELLEATSLTPPAPVAD